jgi:hypothetical protein
MITVVYRDDLGRVCRKECSSVGAAFELCELLISLEPFRWFAEPINRVLYG